MSMWIALQYLSRDKAVWLKDNSAKFFKILILMGYNNIIWDNITFTISAH